MTNSNTQMVQKGKISTLEGELDDNGNKVSARVVPNTTGSIVTRPLTIPWYLRGKMGNLTPGTEVAYAVFEDGTGIILSRMDGKWGGIIEGNLCVENGKILVGSQTNITESDVTVGEISLVKHTHTTHDGESSTPN